MCHLPSTDQSYDAPYKSDVKRDSKAPRHDLIPPCVARRLAGVYTYGAGKYGDKNYLKGWKDPVFRNDVFNHLMEHLYNYNLTKNAEDLDHALCNLAFMVEFDEMDRNCNEVV